MEDDVKGRRFQQYSWVGPQVMSDNGLELRSIVTKEHDGTFQAGTLYGPIGSTMPELGPEEYFVTKSFKSRDEAMFAARQDTNEVLRGCNEFHKEHIAAKLIERVTTPRENKTSRPKEHIKLVIDR